MFPYYPWKNLFRCIDCEVRGMPSQRQVWRSFDVFFDLRLNKRLIKQSRRRWCETPPCSLWRHCNVLCIKWNIWPYPQGIYSLRKHRLLGTVIIVAADIIAPRPLGNTMLAVKVQCVYFLSSVATVIIMSCSLCLTNDVIHNPRRDLAKSYGTLLLRLWQGQNFISQNIEVQAM